MKQTLTLEDIDDYVQALTAFLPTPTQRKNDSGISVCN